MLNQCTKLIKFAKSLVILSLSLPWSLPWSLSLPMSLPKICFLSETGEMSPLVKCSLFYNPFEDVWDTKGCLCLSLSLSLNPRILGQSAFSPHPSFFFLSFSLQSLSFALLSLSLSFPLSFDILPLSLSLCVHDCWQSKRGMLFGEQWDHILQLALIQQLGGLSHSFLPKATVKLLI